MPKEGLSLYISVQSGSSERTLMSLADKAGTGKKRRPRQGRRAGGQSTCRSQSRRAIPTKTKMTVSAMQMNSAKASGLLRKPTVRHGLVCSQIIKITRAAIPGTRLNIRQKWAA